MTKKRRSKKGITTTKHTPKWKRNVRAASKGFVRQAKSALAGVGLVAVIVMIARALS